MTSRDTLQSPHHADDRDAETRSRVLHSQCCCARCMHAKDAGHGGATRRALCVCVVEGPRVKTDGHIDRHTDGRADVRDERRFECLAGQQMNR